MEPGVNGFSSGAPAHSKRLIRSLGVKSPGEMYFCEREEGPLEDGHFLVETLYTGLSAGTELTFYKGTNPYLHADWDKELGIFKSSPPRLKYPLSCLGYMEVSRVVESRTPVVKVDECLAMRYGHKNAHFADPSRDIFVPLPSSLDPILGIYVAQMGPICANGLLHAAAVSSGPKVANIGDGVRGLNVLIVGCGVVGLLTGLFARHHGAANVVMTDETSERLRVAEALGFDVIDQRTDDAALWCKIRWQYSRKDCGADLVFQCRGRSESLQVGLRSLRPQRAVIDLAFYPGGAPDLRLGEEFHHNALTIRAAQISHIPQGASCRWDRRRLAAETIELLSVYGLLIRTHIITDVVSFDTAPSLFAELAQRKRHVLQAVFEVSS